MDAVAWRGLAREDGAEGCLQQLVCVPLFCAAALTNKHHCWHATFISVFHLTLAVSCYVSVDSQGLPEY